MTVVIADYEDYDGLGLAALVADRKVTPLEVLETAYAGGQRHLPSLLRSRPRRGRGRSSGRALPRCAAVRQGCRARRRGYADELRLAPVRGDRLRRRRHPRHPAQGGRDGPGGPHALTRIRAELHDRTCRLRADPQSLGGRPLGRWLFGRCRSRGRGRHHPARPGLRRRRVDPRTRSPLRGVRLQAEPHAQSGRTAHGGDHCRHGCAACHHAIGARQRRPARRHGQCRYRRPLCGRAAGAPVPRRNDARSSAAADRARDGPRHRSGMRRRRP